MILCDDTWPQTGLNFAEVTLAFLEDGFFLLTNSDPVEVLIHALFNVPDHETWVIHGNMIVTSCEETWIYGVPSQSVAMPRVLDHLRSDKNFFDTARGDHIEIRLVWAHFFLRCIYQRYLAILVCCQHILICCNFLAFLPLKCRHLANFNNLLKF